MSKGIDRSARKTNIILYKHIVLRARPQDVLILPENTRDGILVLVHYSRRDIRTLQVPYMNSVIITYRTGGQLRSPLFQRPPSYPTDGRHGGNRMFRFLPRISIKVPYLHSSVPATTSAVSSIRMPIHRECRSIMSAKASLVDTILSIVPPLTEPNQHPPSANYD